MQGKRCDLFTKMNEGRTGLVFIKIIYKTFLLLYQNSRFKMKTKATLLLKINRTFISEENINLDTCSQECQNFSKLKTGQTSNLIT